MSIIVIRIEDLFNDNEEAKKNTIEEKPKESPEKPVPELSQENNSPKPITLNKKKRKLSTQGNRSAKKLRIANKAAEIAQKSNRLAKLQPVIMCTGLKSSQIKKMVTSLKGVYAERIDELANLEFDVLVSDSIKRTVKLIIAINKSIPVVTMEWIKDSTKCNYFVDPMDYIISDPENEKNYNFNLKECIKKVKSETRLLFEGMEFYLFQSIIPQPKEFAPMILSAGGIVRLLYRYLLTFLQKL